MKELIWQFDDTAEKRLKGLFSVASPYSYEVLMGNYLRELWSSQNYNVSTDVLGNVYASLSGLKPIHIGLVAHIDTVAIQITKIMPNGMLLFRSVGLALPVLLGQRVNVVTSKGLLEGIVGFDPVVQYASTRGLMDDDLWIDIGTRTNQESLSLVDIGDFAVLKGEYGYIGKDYITIPAIDDRIGVFIIDECLRWFAGKEVPLHLHAIGSVQEEIGLRGASVIGHNLPLDACFILDVDYATDTLTPHESQLGKLILGEGVGFHRKADNNIVLQRIIREVAEKYSLQYQVSLGRNIYGGTDATSVQLQMGGIATMNINIPCRYIHSTVEMCSLSDVETAINLLIKVIQYIADIEKKCFIPGID